MFYAASMPVPIDAASGFDQVPLHVTHHCDEQASTLPFVKCFRGGHLCCTGLTATIAKFFDDFSLGTVKLINPMVCILALQRCPAHLYKPP
jgi:hypothetical protein